MKISEAWLREWINPPISTLELTEQLTMAGLEVDNVTSVSGKFEDVVIGQVVECSQHPNADKLRVTKVNIGKKSLLNVVCGAANCRQGLKVACAAVGAILPGNFKIKATKLRGEPSEGMLCSYNELGIINVEEEGIIELPEDAPIGVNLNEYLRLPDQQIEMSITPNRADCFSILGLARDIAVVNQVSFNPLIYPVNKNDFKTAISIENQAPQACPRYLARVIKGIDPKASTPMWMKEKLRRCGLRSISPVVDITNFVLLELGQPMHAFDLKTVKGNIVIRMAKKDEKLILLDGNEITLDEQTLMIADQQKGLAVAGVFGGLDSSVTAQSTGIVLECAYFSPLAIAGKARKYGLHTDSSHRYERGVDPNLQQQAMERATQLIVDICGGQVGSVVEVVDSQSLPLPANIKLRTTKINHLLGCSFTEEQIESILSGLGCRLTVVNRNQWLVTPPSWRFDLSIEEDLIEEIARIYGYNNIPSVTLKAELTTDCDKESKISLQKVKNCLINLGYQEAITYSFVDPKLQRQLHPTSEALVLPNPISQDMSAMRVSLWAGLLSAVIYNQHRQQSTIKLFEYGMKFTPDKQAALGIRQEMVLAGVVTGPLIEHWDIPHRHVDFYDLKGDINKILALTNKQNDFSFVAAEHTALHPGQTAAIYLENELIGYVGTIHPELENHLGLKSHAFVYEIKWEKISKCLLPEIKMVSRYPANRRDIAIVVKDDIPANDVLSLCMKVGENQIVDVNLFDVYRGEGITKGYKSLAISLLLQDNARTLEEDEIAATVNQCVSALKERFNASLRD